MISQVDQQFQAGQFEKVYSLILDRVLTDEDKQYKLDIEDIIEEQLYECVQFFNQD